MVAMGLNTEEEGSPMAFFRRGYKVLPAHSALQFVAMSWTLSVLAHACIRSIGFHAVLPCATEHECQGSWADMMSADVDLVGGCLLRGGVS